MVLSLLPLVALVHFATAALSVNTTNGTITGHAASNLSSVTEFLGIPYAAPPVGSLRFAPPAPYNGTGPYVAASYSADCPDSPNPDVGYPNFTSQAQRVINYFSANTDTPQSEDCLTLNIWTPSNATSGRDTCLPVLVFLYGGRFTYGHTNSVFFDGEFLANAEDVVVVTLNYRNNIFRFPGAPGITQNAGLRDQRLAVEWLKDNIAGFGGDPALMSLFGQSAGAVAIDYWSYAYVEDPIVSGLISESGNALSFPLNTANATLSNWYNVTETLGCGSGTSDTLACMRTKNWTDIKAAYEGTFGIKRQSIALGYYALPDYRKNITVTTAQGDSFLLNSFTCPNEFEADNRVAYGVRTWVYRYFGDWPNIRLYNANPEYAGQVIGKASQAYHGSELEMVFGNPSGVSGLPNTEAENEMIALMQGAWAAFTRDPSTGLTEYGWPEYNPESDTLIRLAYNNTPTAEFVDPSLYFAACANYTPSA